MRCRAAQADTTSRATQNTLHQHHPCHRATLPLCDCPPRQLELRRHLDTEGWTADVTALRRTLNAVDRKLLEMRLVER